MTKRKTPLPDRWDFDKWRDGKRLNPPRGHKVGISWGDLLTLEHHLREIEKNLSVTESDMSRMRDRLAETAGDAPTDSPDGFYLALARDAVRNVEFILAELRRSGKWPQADHPDWPFQQVIYADDPPLVKPEVRRLNDLDDETPF